jgi:hypothetical protein
MSAAMEHHEPGTPELDRLSHCFVAWLLRFLGDAAAP